MAYLDMLTVDAIAPREGALRLATASVGKRRSVHI